MKDGPFQRISLNSLFKEKVGVTLEELLKNEGLMVETAKQKGYKTENATWEELYDQLFVNEIESTFSLRPFFLIDFPARVSPLCTPQKAKPLFAQRFELYIHKMEIGNGNTENTDTAMIRNFFEVECAKTGMPIDEDFLSSLKAMKMGSYAGIGIGVDRLTMLYTNSDIFV
jgi:lysyl-tRNA synthetase class II